MTAAVLLLIAEIFARAQLCCDERKLVYWALASAVLASGELITYIGELITYHIQVRRAAPRRAASTGDWLHPPAALSYVIFTRS